MADILGVPREAMEPLEATVTLIGFTLLMWSVCEMKKKEMIRPFQFLSVFRIAGALQNLSVSQGKKKKEIVEKKSCLNVNK